MERGHLAANADYQFAHFRKATYQYFNIAPMSPRFNKNDWKALESHVRIQVKAQRSTAVIITGGLNYGTTHRNYLNFNLRRVLIPNVFYKVISIGNRAIVLFMHVDRNFIMNVCQKRIVGGLNYYYCSVHEFYINFQYILEYNFVNEIYSLYGHMGLLDALIP